MSKGKAHERGLARARERRTRHRRQARRQRWTRGVTIGLVIVAIAALALTLLPPPSPSPVVDDPTAAVGTPEATTQPTAATTDAVGSTEPPVACGGERPAASEQEPPTFNDPPTTEFDPTRDYRATIVTSCGEIVVDLFAERSPATVENLIALARMDYYAGVTFHRVIEGFMIQAGDPTGTGAGDPGYTIEGELQAAEEEGYRRGILAMANRQGDPNTASTQFFIVQGEDVGLDPDYAVFGEVVEGIDVVDLIAAIPTRTVGGQPDVPSETVYIEDVTIEELPDGGSPTPDEGSSP